MVAQATIPPLSPPDFAPTLRKGVWASSVQPQRAKKPVAPPVKPPLKRVPRSELRNIGLTPRLFRELVSNPYACVPALPADYVATISRHVESVDPARNVMAHIYVPVIMEGPDGKHLVYHVDPLVVRSFKKAMVEELSNVLDKRRRMLGRIHTIRKGFPAMQARALATKLRREMEDALSRVNEPLVLPLAAGTKVLHLFVDVTPTMLQLPLVHERLMQELPEILRLAGVVRLSCFALCGGNVVAQGLRCCGSHEEMMIALDEWLGNFVAGGTDAENTEDGIADYSGRTRGAEEDGDSLQLDHTLLQSAQISQQAPARSRRRSCAQQRFGPGPCKLVSAFRRATVAEAVAEEEGNAIVLITSSCPTAHDLEAAVGLAKRSASVLQVVGVFGDSADDPEASLQRLADSGPPGSSLRLFFGQRYWSNFALARMRQLEDVVPRALKEADIAAVIALPSSGGELFMPSGDGVTQDFVPQCEEAGIASPEIFEMRLIERILRECYVEEQRCEAEIICAEKLLGRSINVREEVIATLRNQGVKLDAT